MPIWVLVYSSGDELNILERNKTTLWSHGRFHEQEYSKPKSRSSEKNAQGEKFLPIRGVNGYAKTMHHLLTTGIVNCIVQKIQTKRWFCVELGSDFCD